MSAIKRTNIHRLPKGVNIMNAYLEMMKSIRFHQNKATAHIVAANEALDRINAEVRKADIAMAREIKRINRIQSLIR